MLDLFFGGLLFHIYTIYQLHKKSVDNVHEYIVIISGLMSFMYFDALIGYATITATFGQNNYIL
jgi:hypothetical protein